MKKKIIFIAPRKGGAHNYFKGIVQALNEKYGYKIEITFIYDFSGYIISHFKKYDVIFSIIPFFFKPLRTNQYIYNLHGNYQKERKNNGIGVKLLYLSELNLWFSDTIMLPSYYLADTLGFKERYKDKIGIASNFLKDVKNKNTKNIENEYRFLTITSFDFYNKGKGVISLCNVMKKLGKIKQNEQIHFTIIGALGSKNAKKIKNEIEKIIFPSNVTIVWKGWLDAEALYGEFLSHNTFLYWSELDNFPGVILEALSYNLKVYTNNFEAFSYFLDQSIICVDEIEMLEKIVDNDCQSHNSLGKFQLETVLKDIIKLIG